MNSGNRLYLPQTEAELEDVLSAPTPETIEAMRQIDGDLVILGAGGKMGPSLARLAKRSMDAAGSTGSIVCVSRFGTPGLRESLHSGGIETVSADLLDPDQVNGLPDAASVIYLAGMKFGTRAQPAETWAANTIVPFLCANRYRDSRIVALSTGNVYPFTTHRSGGCTEETPPAPIGEYAQSCLGRERVLEYISGRHNTPIALIRLVYANDLRYGVLADVATKVMRREAVDVSNGWVNAIWQGDANAMLLQAFDLCATPPEVLNLSGPEVLSVREMAVRFASLFSLPTPAFIGSEQPTALLGNAAKCAKLFGPPHVSADTMIEWTADWVKRGGRSLDKPTHFESRSGEF